MWLMHISKLSLVNYRNFLNTEIFFNVGVNTIIGENGSGKTNIFRALRLMLDDNMLRSAHHLDEDDFCRGLGSWKGHWIIISLEFDQILPDEAIQALFLHGTADLTADPVSKATYNLIFRPNITTRLKLSQLEDGDVDGMREILDSLSISDYEAVFTGKSCADFTNPAVYKELVGDFESAIFSAELNPPSIGVTLPKVMSIHREVSFTFIQALRDVVSDFHNNKKNPLFTLLKRMGDEIDQSAMKPIVDNVDTLNTSIEGLPQVQTVRSDILNTIKSTTGETYSPSSLSIKSALSDDAEKLFQSLRLHIGESDDGYEGTISELSLGGANLIYLTLKLLEFKYQRENNTFANFLLIEEPESHLHTHIQKTLFDKINYKDTQIIYSTHSTNISEVSNVENISVIAKSEKACEVYQPSKGLVPTEISNIQRYLDAIRSNLLFAKSVILVEGDAEEILIPILIKKTFGISLDELGISLINIRSAGFKNVANLFHQDRIRKKCSIVTDLDTSTIDTTPNEGDEDEVAKIKASKRRSEKSGVERKVILDDFASDNDFIEVSYAPHTFETDLCDLNKDLFIDVVESVYTDAATKRTAKEELRSTEIDVFSRRALTMADYVGKGWFAVLLGGKVKSSVHIPEYILKAIIFTQPTLLNRVWVDVFKYRISEFKASSKYLDKLTEFSGCLDKFAKKEASLTDIFTKYEECFSDDSFVPIVKLYSDANGD
jgi:putative ATP-dependent endonuclease of the OLD family